MRFENMHDKQQNILVKIVVTVKVEEKKRAEWKSSSLFPLTGIIDFGEQTILTKHAIS